MYFYQLPEHAHYYSELVNGLTAGGDAAIAAEHATVRVLGRLMFHKRSCQVNLHPLQPTFGPVESLLELCKLVLLPASRLSICSACVLSRTRCFSGAITCCIPW